MRRTSVGLIWIASILAGASVASASDQIFWELADGGGGAIEGEILEQGHEGQIEVFDFHHLIHRDYSTFPPGPGMHEEVILTVAPERVTAKLMKALDTGELMSTCRLHFRKALPPIFEVATFFRIELTNARIASIEPIAPSNLTGTTRDLLRVRLSYSAIQLEHVLSSEVVEIVVGKGS